MFGWVISIILAVILVLFSARSSEPLVTTSNTVGLRKATVHIPTVRKEDSPLWSGTPGLKSVLKTATSSTGDTPKKKNIKWADHADYRSINAKGKIIDKTVKI